MTVHPASAAITAARATTLPRFFISDLYRDDPDHDGSYHGSTNNGLPHNKIPLIDL
jgi:hypothetical protein